MSFDQAMPRPALPYLYRELKRGKPVWYFRRDKHSPRTRINGEYGTADFLDQYHAALSGSAPRPKLAPPHKGSLQWLCDRWRESSDWLMKAKSTQRQRDNILKAILSGNGTLPFAGVTKAHITDGRERRLAAPSAANNYLKVMKALFAWAVETNLIETDPAAPVKFLNVKTNGHEPWTHEDVEAFAKHWPIGTRQHVALATVYLTGLRRGDAVRLGKQHVGKDGLARITMEKTGKRIVIAIPTYLTTVWAKGPCGELSFIADIEGRPYSKEGFGNMFREWCNAAGVTKSAHGLRKLAAAETANGGGSEKELQSAFGWSSVGQSSTYTRTAHTETLALSAAQKREENTAFPSHSKPLPSHRKKG